MTNNDLYNLIIEYLVMADKYENSDVFIRDWNGECKVVKEFIEEWVNRQL